MSTIDQAQIRESPPVKDQHSNHWATPPTVTWFHDFKAQLTGDSHCALVPMAKWKCLQRMSETAEWQDRLHPPSHLSHKSTTNSN